MSEELRFDGRVVIVTGSSKGIGRALATLFANKGAKVVVNGRSRNPVEETVAELAAKGGDAVAHVGDISTEDGGMAVVERAIQHYGRLDVVVNNAGILNFCSFGEMSASTFNELLSVNVGSAFHVTRAAWPHLASQKYGRVLMFASQAIFGGVNTAHYCTSKGGVLGLMRALHHEGREFGINVNGIMPLAYTEMHSSTTSSGVRGRVTQALIDLSTLDAKEGITNDSGDKFAAARSRLDPRMLAPLAGWLCHESCLTTGEMLIAGGGHFARLFLAETPGYFNPDASPESVRDNWSEVCREEGYQLPADSTSCCLLSIQRMLAASTGRQTRPPS